MLAFGSFVLAPVFLLASGLLLEAAGTKDGVVGMHGLVTEVVHFVDMSDFGSPQAFIISWVRLCVHLVYMSCRS